MIAVLCAHECAHSRPSTWTTCMVYSVSAGILELSWTSAVCPSTTEYRVDAKVTTITAG